MGAVFEKVIPLILPAEGSQTTDIEGDAGGLTSGGRRAVERIRRAGGVQLARRRRVAGTVRVVMMRVAAAGRLVLRYFNSRTLESVLGARRESIADTLRNELVADLNSYHAGIDVVSVVIEEMD